MAIRLTKSLLIAWAGMFALLAAISNVADYNLNIVAIQHVLKMDTTIPGTAHVWRSLTHPLFHHGAYLLIISTQFLIATLCLSGAFQLFKSRRSVEIFRQKKALAIYGLSAGITLWFGGFITIGGEWFAMWQSKTWNTTQDAFRIAAMFGIFLIYLTTAPDD